MAQVDADLLERYQLDLQQNPRSRVFAPLAEAYRKMGLLDQALEVCKQGVKYHPDFASGRVAYGRVWMDKGDWKKAEEQLLLAIKLSPDNILAHRLLGRGYSRSKQAAKALTSYKHVLLLHPKDEEAQRFVQRWESMSAKDYEDLYDDDAEIFHSDEPQELKKVLSIADAFLVRKEWDRAQNWLESQTMWRGHPQVQKRLSLIPAPATPRQLERKVRYLRKLLRRIETASNL